MPFSEADAARAAAILKKARAHGLRLMTAESCTGGLVSALLTEVAGASDVVERGVVTYSNQAKHDLLGVSETVIETHGAVSAEVAEAMVRGALDKSPADVAVAVTGVAGPGGGTADKPVGLVYLAGMRRGDSPIVEEHRFGNEGRSEIRARSVAAALALVERLIEIGPR